MKTLDQFIGVYEGAVPADVCKGIVDFYGKHAAWKKSTYSGYDGLADNSDQRVDMMDFWIQPGQPFFDDISNALIGAVKRYVEQHPDFSVAKSNGFRINRYGPGGFMSRHVDNIHNSHGQKEGFPLASCSIMLNENFAGGDFVFFDEVVIPAKTGQAIVFPSNFLFPHAVSRIESGVRYSIVTWML